MQKQKLILIGGGGHCKACIDVIEQTEKYEILGILDLPANLGSKVLGYEIIGTDDNLINVLRSGVQFLITVGQIKSAEVRIKIFQMLKAHSAELATVISPKAYVSNHAIINSGTIVMHNVIVNAAAVVGNNCILNTGCTVEHDTVIGDHTHISTHAILNGGSIVGNEVFIGSNVTVSNGQTINDLVVIGAGSVVKKNINQPGIYKGNPLLRINS